MHSKGGCSVCSAAVQDADPRIEEQQSPSHLSLDGYVFVI